MVSFKGEPLAELGNRGGKDGRNLAIPLAGGGNGGSRAAPLGGLGSREDGPRRPVRGEGRPAADCAGGGGAPAVVGGGEGVGELHHGERKLAVGLSRA